MGGGMLLGGRGGWGVERGCASGYASARCVRLFQFREFDPRIQLPGAGTGASFRGWADLVDLAAVGTLQVRGRASPQRLYRLLRS